MRFLIDMNLSPRWTLELARIGHDGVHWIDVGAANAHDEEILAWAVKEGYVVLTADLDFGTALAERGFDGPAVVQLRLSTTDPESIRDRVTEALSAFGAELHPGAILTVGDHRARLRPGLASTLRTDGL